MAVFPHLQAVVAVTHCGFPCCCSPSFVCVFVFSLPSSAFSGNRNSRNTVILEKERRETHVGYSLVQLHPSVHKRGMAYRSGQGKGVPAV